MKLKAGEILEATGGELIRGSENENITGASIDTRTLREGEAFIALKGENFDGHDFIQEALKKGASALIISNFQFPISNFQFPIIKVSNTLRALGDIAHYWRIRFKIPVVAITGSNGKTTTKEMLASILSARFKVLKSKGNLNNQIGLPLTLFDLCPQDEVAILEMGTNHFGEIRYLARIAEPEIGLITNIGQAHLQYFKNLKGVVRAKGELLEEIKRAVLPHQSPYLDRLKREFKGELWTFGLDEGADLRAVDIKERGLLGSSFRLKRRKGEPSKPIELPLVGKCNILNALAASLAAFLFGCDQEEIRTGLSQARIPSWRMESFKLKGAKVINDCYNANPSSMLEALKTLEGIPGGRRILIIGDMTELGEGSGKLHQELGKKIAKSKIDVLLTVGELAAKAGEEAAKKEVYPCADNIQAALRLEKIIEKEDIVLIKGSRKMKMEEIMEALSTERGARSSRLNAPC